MTTSTAVRRFSVSDRVEHWVQVITFTVLAVTGLIQRYDGVWVSDRLIGLFGGIESTRNIHRVFATILMIAVVYHFGSAGYRRYVRKEPKSMVPTRADARAIKDSLAYALGRRDEPPPQGRFTWEEKIEYWSFVWGTVLMVVTGYLLWNPIATTRFLPGEFIPTAQAAHGGEAVLAVLAIIVWHVYHVHIRHFNRSMFGGLMSRAEMKEFHPLELASIDAGTYSPPPEPERNRLFKRFLPAYGSLAVVLLAGIYLFVSFEDTAIATIEPPEQVRVFAPVETLPSTTTIATTTTTTVTTTTIPGGPGDSWDGTIAALFDPACTTCHGENLQSGGLALSSYEAALTGGGLGAGIVPGDPDASAIVQVMEAGGHPQVLSADAIAVLRAWIADGAPETAEPVEPGDADATWEDAIASLFDPTCTSCHGSVAQIGGLSLASYESALTGTANGAGIVPGDADGSLIVQVMEAGGHAQQLSAGEIALLRAWIDAGAAP